MIGPVPSSPNARALSACLIEFHERGVVLRQPMPVSMFGSLARHFKREGFRLLALNLCAPLDAVAVLVKSEKDSNAWAAELDDDAKRRAGGDAEMAWLMGTDTGTSSRTIFAVLAGRGHLAMSNSGGLGSPPWDPADFGRCYRLLELFPEWRARLGEVAKCYPAWTRLVENWPQLEDLYRDERFQRSAPKLYARMKELLK